MRNRDNANNGSPNNGSPNNRQLNSAGPDKITVSAGQDLLAFIPHIVGYWPAKSVVCIGMSGKGLRATMRLDLPSPGFTDLDSFATIAAVQLAGDTAADSCLIAFFGDADWTDPEDFPQAGLFAAMLRAFSGVGLPVRDAWFVGPDHWRHVDCNEPDCCGWPGISNDAIASSMVNAELIYRGSSVDASPRETICRDIAATDPTFAAGVGRAAAPMRRKLFRHGMDRDQLALSLGVWERALTHWPEPPTEQAAGFLLGTLGNVAVRDTVLVAMATGPDTALAGALGLGITAAAARHLTAPADWDPDGTEAASYTVDAVASEEASEAFGDVLMGGGLEPCPTGAVPDWARLNRADALLVSLARAASGQDKAAVLCMLGWIQWCKGRGTRAAVYFGLSQEYSPGYRLAALLDALLDSGYVAGWAKNAGTAWPGEHQQRAAAQKNMRQ